MEKESIDSIVKDYIGEAELSMSQYFKLWQIAFRGMYDLGIDFFYEIKTIKIPLSANGTAALPPNINWTKVGVFSDGAFLPLWYNENLTNYASLSEDRRAQTNGGVIDTLDAFYSLSSPTFYNYGGVNLWGGSWIQGAFNVDEKNNVIVFDNWTSYSDVAVEIMAAPTPGEEYYIPSVFREALIEWIGWRDIKHLPRGRRSDSGEKRDRKHDYYNARRLAQSRFKPFVLTL